MTDVSPDAKKQIEEAYATFRAQLRDIAHEHRVTVGELLTQLDQAHVDSIHKKLNTDH